MTPMRWITAVVLLLGLPVGSGCEMIANSLFDSLARDHYTNAGTPAEREAQFHADLERSRESN